MKKLLSLILTLTMCIVFPLTASAEEPPEVGKNVFAKSAVLLCMDTGEVLYQFNEKEHLSPASVTKIMTILLVLEALDNGKITLDDAVTASPEAVSMGGSQIWLEVGETMTVAELLKAVVVASANDACTALAEYVGGSSTGFVHKMNDRAAALGLTDTHFENSNGLDDTTTNHYSCAYDLAVIAAEVMRHEMIKEYTGIWLDSLRGGKTELNNTNKLVNTYNGITGLKTGTTSNAGFCIAATAEREGMNLVAVVLGSETSAQRFDTAAYLLDWGFANYQVITPEIDESKITEVMVERGKMTAITPIAESGGKLLIQRGEGDITYQYQLKKQVTAPIKRGDKLGEIIVSSAERQLGSIVLTAPQDVQLLTLKDVFRDILLKI